MGVMSPRWQLLAQERCFGWNFRVSGLFSSTLQALFWVTLLERRPAPPEPVPNPTAEPLTGSWELFLAEAEIIQRHQSSLLSPDGGEAAAAPHAPMRSSWTGTADGGSTEGRRQVETWGGGMRCR